VSYIAQNGMQLGYGMKATVSGNTVSGNAYSGLNLASSGGIVNNKVSGFGYTPQTPDCSGTHPAFLRFVDLDSPARGVPSSK
jgi:parallel beta-helix repeat protein